MQLTEIRLAGFGGQGVILSAIVLGKAASIHQGAFATMTQSFGPEARGGACSAQLIVSGTPVLYPYVTRPDILVVMSQEAYGKFVPELKDGGSLKGCPTLQHTIPKTGSAPRSARSAAGVRRHSW